MTLKIDEDCDVVFCSESSEGVGFVLEDSLFDFAGHADVENAPLAGENVDVVDLGHIRRLMDWCGGVSDGGH